MYSGGQSRSNHRLHAQVARLALAARAGAKKPATGPLRLAYLPSEDEGAELFFSRAMRRYRSAGFERFFMLELDTTPTTAEVALALSCDAIYLAGGNTYTFLDRLRRTGMLAHLAAHARSGGVLAGLSAGAILMSPTIGLAGVPRFDADENEIGLRDLRAMGLVDFEFSPHDTAHPARSRELLEYCAKVRRPVFSVADGGGLVLEGDRLGLHGRVKLYSRGECWRLN